jgi:hypothetical protein
MNEVSATEIWQVEVQGAFYETNFEELTHWIAEGALQKQDKVRRGNLRWIEAGKVPLLHGFFNARELGTAPPVVTLTEVQPPVSNNSNFPNYQPHNSFEVLEDFAPTVNLEQLSQSRPCLLHPEWEAKYFCPTCSNSFCAECPKSIGGGFKNCPMCGAMCESIAEVRQEIEAAQKFEALMNEGFGVTDFGRALAYPFKFKVSLIVGAMLFMFFCIGQDAASLGGRWLITAGLISGMLANMLTFGILANVVENMLQHKLDRNFMPSFDDFSLWDDMIHPFFLSLGVYLSAFLPLILLIIGMIFFVASSTKNEEVIKNAPSILTPEIMPNYEGAKNGKEQIEMVKKSLELQEEHRRRQEQAIEESYERSQSLTENAENSNVSPIPQFAPNQPALDEEKEFEEYQNLINKTRRQQLESTIGKEEPESDGMFGSLSGMIKAWSLPFFLLALIFGAWGVFYLPVAYIVAAYTRNFFSVLNPSIGLDTIKRLGVDYVKILLMGVILLVINAGFGFVLSALFAPLNLPRLGNIPAIAVGSLFTFYLSIVFSLILGYALFKNSDKFQMYQSS